MKHTIHTSRSLSSNTLALSTLVVLASCGGGGGERSQLTSEIQFPPESGLTDATSIWVRGTVSSPASIAGLTVAGFPASSTDGWSTWSVEVPLELGDNQLEARMTGINGEPVGNPDAIFVHRDGVVLGDCNGLVVGGIGEEKAWWLDADLGRLVEIDTTNDSRSFTNISNSPFEASAGFQQPGFPVFDSTRNRIYVPDGPRIHAVSVDQGTRAQVCTRGLFGWVIDLDYDPTSDRLLSLENDGILGGFVRQVFSIDPDSGARELICSFQPTGFNGDIAAHSISIFRDGSGQSALLASTDAVSLLSLPTGSRLAFPAGLSNIRDVASWNFEILLLDREEGVFELTLGGDYECRYDFADPSSPFENAFRLEGGFSQDEIVVTDATLDAAFRINMQTETTEELCRSAAGAGPGIESASSTTRFRGEMIVVDPAQDRVFSVAADGSRHIFSEGNMLTSPEAALAVGDALYVGCSSGGRIVQIDAHGNQTLVIDGSDDLGQLRSLAYSNPPQGPARMLALCSTQLVEIDLANASTNVIAASGDGNGPDFTGAQDVVVHADLGIAMISTAGQSGGNEGAVMTILLDGGFRWMLAGEDPISGSIGSGNSVSIPRGLAYLPESNELIVAAGRSGPGAMSMYRLHLPSLQRSELSTLAVGRGPMVDQPESIYREELTGNLYVAGRTEGAVLVIDPESGDRVMISR